MGTRFECCGYLFGGSAKHIAILFPWGFSPKSRVGVLFVMFLPFRLGSVLQLNYQKLTSDQSWAAQILLQKFEIWNLVFDKTESY